MTQEQPSKTNLELKRQIQAALQLKKYPLAKLLSLFESQSNDAYKERSQVIDFLNQTQLTPDGVVIGITGTPGAGKSSLIAALSDQLLATNKSIRLAVIAVDPSSQISGGAILGDRLRMRTQGKQPRLFFRSQASNLELGGVTQNSYQASRLLKYFFDLVFIETVGIGQNEIEIQQMVDHTLMVMQPLAGDQIQFMKSGIMEIPDSFVINKCDEEKLARRSHHMLRTALRQAQVIHPDEQTGNFDIFLTSASKGTGISALAEFLASIRSQNAELNRDAYYVKKAIARDYGLFGTEIFEQCWQAVSTMRFEEMDNHIRNKIQERIRP